MATSTLGSGTLVLAGTTSGTTTVTATAVAGTTTLTLPAATDTLVGKATTDTLTNKTLTGAVMNGTLGATTPSTVAATTLTTSSTVTHNGGTANGVAYLDGSKVLTTGSALVFDGTNLGVGVTPSAYFYPAVSLANGSFYSRPDPSAGVATNAYSSTSGGGWKYIATAAAARYEQSAGSHAWSTAASGTAGNAISFTSAMTLDASSRLGVASSSPDQTVTIGTGGLGIDRTNSTLTPANDSKGLIYVRTNGNPAGTQDELRYLARNHAWFDHSGNRLASIDSSGNLLVGTTSAVATATRAGFYNAGSASPVVGVQNARNVSGDSVNSWLIGSNCQNTSSFFLTCGVSGVANVLYIYGNGNVQNTNNSYGAISDVKLKENIVDATPKLADLMQVKVRSYNLKSDPLHKQLGVIAQELETIFPGLIDESPDYEPQIKTREVEVPAVAEVRDNEGNIVTEAVEATTRTEEYTEQVALGTKTKAVKYSVFVPMLIKAMQEQQALITQLQADVAALKGA